MSDRRPRITAERSADYRERQRTGAVCFSGTAPAVLVEQMIDMGLLSEQESFDGTAIGRALVEMAAILLGTAKRQPGRHYDRRSGR